MKKHVSKLIAGTSLALVLVTGARAGSTSGSASAIPAYYDHNLFTIQFVEFSPAAEKSLLQHNTSLNFIYQSDPGLPGGQPFISVNAGEITLTGEVYWCPVVGPGPNH